jgi:hypothetical protein
MTAVTDDRGGAQIALCAPPLIDFDEANCFPDAVT